MLEIKNMNLKNLFNETMLIDPDKMAIPNAWSGHIPFMAWLIAALKPNMFVELGTHNGTSYLAACQAVAENRLATKCYAVDTWQGDEHAGRYTDEIFHDLFEYHNPKYLGFSRLLRMTFDEALNDFGDHAIDLLHIDGLHTYEAVKHDFDTWLPKVSDRGVILFHDIAVHERDFGVWKLWAELKERYPSIEFEHSHGLGVLFAGAAMPDELKLLISSWANAQDRQSIIKLFSLLGQRISQQCELLELKPALENCNRQLHEFQLMVNSRSWKITKPLRWASRFLARWKE
jgi:hypothetical protein